MQAYQAHLCTIKNGNPRKLDQSILLLQHTSRMIELFSGKHAIYQINDIRLHYLREALQFFEDWYEETRTAKRQFLSEKLWFDLNSMILGFCYMVHAKLQRFPGSVIKPCIINQDVVENHFCQLRAANGQNENPTYSLVESTQNSIIFRQKCYSKKSNTGHAKNYTFAELPKDKLFSTKK